MKRCNEILRTTFHLTEMMLKLADLGDGARQDVGCGVLYGVIRDAAYKIRKVAQQEKDEHIRQGLWREENRAVKSNGNKEVFSTGGFDVSKIQKNLT